MAYLYRHFSENNELLYVGISVNPFQRTKQHELSSKWFCNVANITIEKCGSMEEAAEKETIAINKEKPKYNSSKVGTYKRSKERALWNFLDGVSIEKRIESVDFIYSEYELSKLFKVNTCKIRKMYEFGYIEAIIFPDGQKKQTLLFSGVAVLKFLQRCEKYKKDVINA